MKCLRVNLSITDLSSHLLPFVLLTTNTLVKSSLSHLGFLEEFFRVYGCPLNLNDFANLFSEIIRSSFAYGNKFIFKLCFKHLGEG